MVFPYRHQDRESRQPFFDCQTGVAQRDCHLFPDKRRRLMVLSATTPAAAAAGDDANNNNNKKDKSDSPDDDSSANGGTPKLRGMVMKQKNRCRSGQVVAYEARRWRRTRIGFNFYATLPPGFVKTGIEPETINFLLTAADTG